MSHEFALLKRGGPRRGIWYQTCDVCHQSFGPPVWLERELPTPADLCAQGWVSLTNKERDAYHQLTGKWSVWDTCPECRTTPTETKERK